MARKGAHEFGHARRVFNRPKPCPSCGEDVYPADPDVVIKHAGLRLRGRNRVGNYQDEQTVQLYFCNTECYSRYMAASDEQVVEPLLGEMLGDGARAMHASEEDD